MAFSFEQTTIGDIPSVHFRKTFYDVRSDVRHLSSYAARVRGPSSGCRLAFVFVCVCLVGACVCVNMRDRRFSSDVFRSSDLCMFVCSLQSVELSLEIQDTNEISSSS